MIIRLLVPKREYLMVHIVWLADERVDEVAKVRKPLFARSCANFFQACCNARSLVLWDLDIFQIFFNCKHDYIIQGNKVSRNHKIELIWVRFGIIACLVSSWAQFLYQACYNIKSNTTDLGLRVQFRVLRFGLVIILRLRQI